jgi:uncharacterized protein (TIGR02646 family)
MRTIRKGREPRSLQTYRLTKDSTFEDLPTETKQDIRDQLVNEQRGLCCYCQSRIRAKWNLMKVEHWQSQSDEKYPERQLDYSNMLGACLGGQKHGEKSPPDTHHCDTAKGDTDLCFSVCEPSSPIEERIHFLGNGVIGSQDSSINDQLNKVLNLNLPHLVRNRKALLMAFKQRLDSGRRFDPVREMPKWDGSQPGELEPFAQVVVYYLRKRQARAGS